MEEEEDSGRDGEEPPAADEFAEWQWDPEVSSTFQSVLLILRRGTYFVRVSVRNREETKSTHSFHTVRANFRSGSAESKRVCEVVGLGCFRN